MKTPDKIYVTIDRPAEKVLYNPELVGVAWSEKDKSCEHIEYIRKDALLKWAKSRIEKYDRVLALGHDSMIVAQRVLLVQLIDKLNSM